MEVRDLWPESIVAVGAINEGRIYKFLEWVELRLYKSAKKIIVVTDAFKRISLPRYSCIKNRCTQKRRDSRSL